MGGIPGWRNHRYPMTVNKEYSKIKVKTIKPEKALAMLDEETDLFIVDARPPDFKKITSFLKGSKIHPLMTLAENYHTIPKDRKIIVNDGFMRQSQVAAKFLILKGYNVVGVVKGGMSRWLEEGLPSVSREEISP